MPVAVEWLIFFFEGGAEVPNFYLGHEYTGVSEVLPHTRHFLPISDLVECTTGSWRLVSRSY